MANPENIVGKGFDKRPENRHNGRPPGQKNRSTVLREIMEMIVDREDLTGIKQKMPVEVAVMQALALKAMEGDVPAIKEAADSLYGKPAQFIKQEIDQTVSMTVEDRRKEADAEANTMLGVVKEKTQPAVH